MAGVNFRPTHSSIMDEIAGAVTMVVGEQEDGCPRSLALTGPFCRRARCWARFSGHQGAVSGRPRL